MSEVGKFAAMLCCRFLIFVQDDIVWRNLSNMMFIAHFVVSNNSRMSWTQRENTQKTELPWKLIDDVLLQSRKPCKIPALSVLHLLSCVKPDTNTWVSSIYCLYHFVSRFFYMTEIASQTIAALHNMYCN